MTRSFLCPDARFAPHGTTLHPEMLIRIRADPHLPPKYFAIPTVRQRSDCRDIDLITRALAGDGNALRAHDSCGSSLFVGQSVLMAAYFSAMIWMRLPHVSSKTAIMASPTSVGG